VVNVRQNSTKSPKISQAHLGSPTGNSEEPYLLIIEVPRLARAVADALFLKDAVQLYRYALEK